MNCDQARELLEQRFIGDGTSPDDARQNILAEHVRTCPKCECFLDDLSLVNESLASLDPPEIPDNLEQSIIASLPRTAAWEQRPAPVIGAAAHRPRLLAWLDSLLAFRRQPAMIGALAVLLAAVGLSLIMVTHTPPEQPSSGPAGSDQPEPAAAPAHAALGWTTTDGGVLDAGTELATARGETVTLTSGGHSLTVRPNSAIRLESRAVAFKRGEMLARFDPLPAPYRFETRGYTVEILGTELGFRSIPAGGIEVAVLEGKVGVTSPAGRKMLLTGYRKAFLSSRGITGPEIMSEGEKRLWYTGRGGRENDDIPAPGHRPGGSNEQAATEEVPSGNRDSGNLMDKMKNGQRGDP